MYEVLVERSVERALGRLPHQEYARIVVAMKDLARNPRPVGCRKLVGGEQDWRVRGGDYRILDEIDETRKIVHVLHVKHRWEAYR